MSSLQRIREYLRYRFGYDVVRYNPRSHPVARRARLMETYDIDVVFDVGANIGQYGRQLRSAGYNGRILSFEPLDSAYRVLLAECAKDPLWTAHNFALGRSVSTAMINIAGNSYSSSLREMLASHSNAAPESQYVGREQVSIKTLDSIFRSECPKRSSILLKIDTQGFEMDVLEGAAESLDEIDTLQVEMSLIALYDGETLFAEMYPFLIAKGYELVAIDPAFTDATSGRMLQVDGVFHKFRQR